MIDPVVGYVIVLGIALLFATAAIHKLRDPHRFREVLSADAVLPAVLVPAVARLLPILELLAALLLVSGAGHAAAAALPAMALLVLYAAVLAVNLVRGRRDLDCGCGPARAHRPIAAWMVWRNGLLAALLGASVLMRSARPLGIADFLILACAVAVMSVLYAAFDRLVGEVMPRAVALRRHS